MTLETKRLSFTFRAVLSKLAVDNVWSRHKQVKFVSWFADDDVGPNPFVEGQTGLPIMNHLPVLLIGGDNEHVRTY